MADLNCLYGGEDGSRPDLKNGRPLTYSTSARVNHRNHINIALSSTGPAIKDLKAAIDYADARMKARPGRTRRRFRAAWRAFRQN